MATYKTQVVDSAEGMYVQVKGEDGLSCKLHVKSREEANRLIADLRLEERIKNENMRQLELFPVRVDEKTPFEFEIKIKLSGTVERSRYSERRGAKTLPAFSPEVFSKYEVRYHTVELEEALEKKIVRKLEETLGLKFQPPGRYGYGSKSTVGLVNSLTVGTIVQSGLSYFIARSK